MYLYLDCFPRKNAVFSFIFPKFYLLLIAFLHINLSCCKVSKPAFFTENILLRKCCFLSLLIKAANVDLNIFLSSSDASYLYSPNEFWCVFFLLFFFYLMCCSPGVLLH